MKKIIKRTQCTHKKMTFTVSGAEECSLAFHEGRSLAALTWVAQQPRQGMARSSADEEADQLAEVAAAYADRCEHVLGPCDRLPGANGAPSGRFGGRPSEYGSQADNGFTLLQVRTTEASEVFSDMFLVVPLRSNA